MEHDEFDDLFDDYSEEKRQRMPDSGEAEEFPFWCAACGEENWVLIDPTGGPRQKYTEDCAVCCRPNLLTIQIDSEGGVMIGNELEYE